MTKEKQMSRLVSFCSAAALLVCAAGVAVVQAGHRAVTLAVIMTNDPMTNQVKVYDVNTHVLLQTLSTHGKGGVGGNARASSSTTASSSRPSTTGRTPSPSTGATETASNSTSW
jgi:hypothetical protein